MAASLAQIREGLRQQLAEIDGIQCTGYLIANPTPPALEITLDDDSEYLTMQRGAITWKFLIRAYAGLAEALGAQKKLDELMATDGPTSVREAIEAKAAGDLTVTLGGIVQDVAVTTLRGPRFYQRADGITYIGAEWLVDVIAAGT
jgi:hypothetical protein